MKKHLIVVALILFIAVGGVFAEDDPITPPAGPVKVTLTGSVEGDVFYHGFTNSSGAKYQTGFTVSEDAFGSVAPTLTYGYKAKYANNFKSLLTVTPFKISGGTKEIAISEVRIGDSQVNPDSNSEYLVLTYTDKNIKKEIETTIQVIPALSEDDDVGDYISTLTIRIDAY